MSTLWTPSGEHDPSRRAGAGSSGPAGPSGGPGGPDPDGPDELDAEQLRELVEQLSRTPVAAICAQLALQLQEIAAIHLSLAGERSESLDEARLAIDAMGAVVEGLGDRLGPNAEPLARALANIRFAAVDVADRLAG